MRYYIDTEFNERGHEHPIELISLGIVREDGQELYAVLEDGWSADHSNDWVKANVLPYLGESRHPLGPWSGGSAYVQPARISRRVLAYELVEWIGSDKPEFWGYYADYDWVLFCQLWGAMVDLPKDFPFFCRDLIQVATDLDYVDEMKLAVPLVNAHNALADALNIKARHEWILTNKAGP